MAYDKNTDYAALIAGTKDPVKKAEYEAARNEKIAAMNKAGTNTGGYTATYDYTQKPNAGAAAAGSGASPVSYIDANGNKKTGYISGGITYTDQSLKNQVGVGSVVTAGDGKEYIKTQNGGQLYSDYLAQNGIRKVDTMDHASGARGSGYVKDGTTYADPLLTQRIASGTVVNTDGGEYIKTDHGSMLYSDYLATYGKGGYDLSAYLRQQQAAAVEAELAGLKGAYEQSLAAYEAALARLPQTYDAARNAVAGQNAIARMSFDERANAMGLGSGARGQADLARSSVYRGTLAGIDREQANAASDIELTKANLQSQYETAIAQAKANSDATLANALYQELVRVQDLTRNDAQRAQNIALQYGLGKGDSLGGIASIRSIDDLADLIYGGSAARYTRSYGDGTGRSTVTIPGYGEVTYETAERMEKNGSITLVGVDASGNPLYVKNQLPQSFTSAYNDWLIQQQKR